MKRSLPVYALFVAVCQFLLCLLFIWSISNNNKKCKRGFCENSLHLKLNPLEHDEPLDVELCRKNATFYAIFVTHPRTGRLFMGEESYGGVKRLLRFFSYCFRPTEACRGFRRPINSTCAYVANTSSVTLCYNSTYHLKSARIGNYPLGVRDVRYLNDILLAKFLNVEKL